MTSPLDTANLPPIVLPDAPFDPSPHARHFIFALRIANLLPEQMIAVLDETKRQVEAMVAKASGG